MKLWGAGLAVSVALLAPAAGAEVRLSSGDTCTASGSGTSYGMTITLPSNASEQGGFAFGASGVTVKSIKDAGNPGIFSTQNLPVNTTGAWLLTSPQAVPGSSVTPALATSGPVTGSFTVVPGTATTGGATMTYLDPIRCALVKGTPSPSNKFTVQQRVTYDSATGSWYVYVTVPGRGKVSIGAKGTQKSLIHDRTDTASRAGKVRLPLDPTTAGKAALKATGSIKLRLIIEFSPKGGKPANKALTLTLKK